MNSEFDPQIADVASRLEKLGRPRLSATARQRIWQKACDQACIPAVTSVVQPRRVPAFWRVLVGALVAFSLMFAGTAWAAAQSLPGDALYPLARSLESARLTLVSAAQRPSLQLQFLDRRAAEIQALVELGRPVPPELLAEVVALVEHIVGDPEAWGGETMVAPHVNLQEQALQQVLRRYPNDRAAERAFQAVNAARQRLRPGPADPALTRPTPHPGDKEWTPPGQQDKDKPVPPGQEDKDKPVPPGQEDKDKPVPPGQEDKDKPVPPGQEDKDKPVPPGQGGTPPGQGDKDKSVPPGQEKKDQTDGEILPPTPESPPPGQGGTPPGQGGTPPGQGGTPPGQGGTPPGQGGTPPGQGGTPPGQGGTPPGQSDPPPGQGGTPPGQSDPPPGQGGTPPGQSDPPPGQGGTPPGQNKK